MNESLPPEMSATTFMALRTPHTTLSCLTLLCDYHAMRPCTCHLVCAPVTARMCRQRTRHV